MAMFDDYQLGVVQHFDFQFGTVFGQNKSMNSCMALIKFLNLAVWNLLGRCALRHASCLGYCTTLPLDSSLVERDWCKTEVLPRELFLSTLGTYLLLAEYPFIERDK